MDPQHAAGTLDLPQSLAQWMNDGNLDTRAMVRFAWVSPAQVNLHICSTASKQGKDHLA